MKEYIISFLIVLFLSGCRPTIDKEQKDFEKEYERHKEQLEEPYIPIP